MKKTVFLLVLHIACAHFFSQQSTGESTHSAKQNAGTLNSSEMEALDFHNIVRANVGVERLEWSPELAIYAKNWAEQLAKNECSIRHRTSADQEGKTYGENIAWSSANDYTLADASKAWYSEIKFFKNQVLNATNWYESGHYTQMVWRDSKEVGMGIAKCSGGGTIVVANYNPSGNYMGEKAY